MKTRITLALAVLLTSLSFAQQGINYKALIKDGSSNVVASQSITVQFQILKGTGMTNVYQETHTPTTDANGLMVVNIGEGTTGDVFIDINWRSDDHYLNVQINTGGGLVDVGTTQFMAVPYAIHAETAANAATKIDDLSDGKSDTRNSSLFIGNGAGFNDDGSGRTGLANVGIGFNALYSNVMGVFNTATGYAALNFNTGSLNAATGYQALYLNTSGGANTASGTFALRNNNTGNNNTANGYDALSSNTLGSLNVAMGYQAGFNSLGDSNIFIGYQSGKNETGSDKLYIDNSDTANPLIYGEFNNNLLTFHGKVGIDTKTPSTKLQIVGGTDASLADGSGYLVLGNEFGLNVVIDENEIIARANGGVSTLFLQNNGGNLSVGGSVVHSSDRRLKRDIETLPYGLKEILKLQPKAYNWKSRETKYKSLGLIAQDVQPIINTIVHQNDDAEKTLSISYTELIPVLTKAIQEQQEIIENLRGELKAEKVENIQQNGNYEKLLKRVEQIELATNQYYKNVIASGAKQSLK